MMRPAVQTSTQSPDCPRAVADALADARLGPDIGMLGNPALAEAPLRIALIGSREVGTESLSAMEALASELASRGVVIVSGAARGTDLAAQRAALDRGGSTIACLPGGLGTYGRDLDRLFPNFDEQRILCLSPFAKSQPITTRTPILRNRLIAALAHVVVAGETRLHSGTHTCTRVAKELGIPVFYMHGWKGIEPDVATALGNMKGARLFTPAECYVDLAADVIAAAKQSLLARAAAQRAQLSLFDQP